MIWQKMTENTAETIVHLVKVGQKSLENDLTKIQWPELNEKQTKKVQETIPRNVS